MHTSQNPQAAADQTHNAYRKMTDQIGLLGLDTSIPETVRSVAEKTVAQSRDVYDRSKDVLDASMMTFERSFDAAGQGATAFNRKSSTSPSGTSIRSSIWPRAWRAPRT
jgi:hypothetical protein